MIDYRQAQEMILQQARSFGRESLPLEQALGRVLAETITADRDYPPFHRATMDGYALKFADLEKGIRSFTITETIFAGSSSAQSIGEGECYKIMTGGAVPEAADIVIRRENVEESSLAIQLPLLLQDPLPAGTLPAPSDPSFPWRRGQNIARKGEDLLSGSPVIDSPCLIGPAMVGLLATLGSSTVVVEKLPRIALLTTGNEVVAVDAPVSPVQIRNSNRWMLEAALKKEGVDLASCSHAPDDPVLLREELQRLLSYDIVILCGGVSAGDADYVPATLEALGVKKLFHKMAIRPGKPTWCGRTEKGTMVFALPGNPFSCLVNMILLIRPFLQACYGIPPSEPLGLPLGLARKKRSPLDEFFPVHVHGSPARLTPVTLNGSGDIRLGMQANGLALHPAGIGDLTEGATVFCYSFV